MTEMEPASRKRKLSSFEEEAENGKNQNLICCPFNGFRKWYALNFQYNYIKSIASMNFIYVTIKKISDKKVNETEDERCRKCPYLDTIDRWTFNIKNINSRNFLQI